MSLGLHTLRPATLLSGRYKQEQIPDLSGRIGVVTGGSAGIGYHDALGLARAGARVLILSATPEHGHQAEAQINEFLNQNTNQKGTVKWIGVEFGDLKQVDAVAKRIANEEERLDILINNAGVGQAPWKMGKDGVEEHFAVNNLAHYVLTLRLLPLMQKTAKSAPPNSVRIVMQSSEMHRVSPNEVHFASLEEINEKRDGALLYGRTKLGLILFAKQLVKRKLASPNEILITSCHPGTVDTDIQTAWTESYHLPGKLVELVMRVVGKTAPEGAEASLWLATSTDVGTEHQGHYYSEAYGEPDTESGQGKDESLGNAWWEFCRQQTNKILGEELN